MSSRVIGYLHEALTNLELMLMGRFARREGDRALTTEMTQRHMFGPVDATLGSSLDNVALAPYMLQGLEVTCGAGSSAVSVTAGALVCTAQNQATENRPGTWTGRVETDDYPYGMHVLPAQVSAAPSTPISVSSPTVAVEWWLVYLIPTAAAVESNTQVPILNVATGQYQMQSQAKVEQHQVTIGVVRGTPGGNRPAVPTYLLASGFSAACPVIASLQVPSGATDLANALVFDERRLPVENGFPNEIVDGAWQCPILGQAVAPYSAPAFVGSVTARIQGEIVSVRSTGTSLAALLDPLCTWNAAASVTTPKVAYLYLCRVGGRVPRLRRQGSTVIGSDLTVATPAMLEGAIVLSSRPPVIGSTFNVNQSTQSGYRWDLRPNVAALGLPAGYGATTLVSKDDAICIGVMIYTGYDAANKVPLVYGPILGDRDGWFRGEGISLSTLNVGSALAVTGAGFAIASHPLATYSATVNTPVAGNIQATFGSAAQLNYTGPLVPIDEVEMSATYNFVANAIVNPTSAAVRWQNGLSGVLAEDMFSKNLGTPTIWSVTRVSKANMPLPGAALIGIQGYPSSSVHLGTAFATGCQIGNQSLVICLTGIRWPWRAPLVT